MKYSQIINSVAFVASDANETGALRGLKTTHVPAPGFDVFVANDTLTKLGSTRISRIVRIGDKEAYHIVFTSKNMGVMPFWVDEDVRLEAYKTTRTLVELEAEPKQRLWGM